MKYHVLFALLGLLLLVACGGGSSAATADDAVAAFQAAGLEAENPSVMGPDDYGAGPYVGDGRHFFLPSVCDDCGGRVIATENIEDRDRLANYYIKLGEGSAIFYSHVFTHNNFVLQLNGDLPEEEAVKYQAALESLE